MRCLFLHSHLSGYFLNCVETLRAAGAEVAVVARRPAENAPFELDQSKVNVFFEPDDLAGVVRQFAPTCVVLGGWWNRSYIDVARDLRQSDTTVVLTVDLPWFGSIKQRAKLSLIRRRIAGAATHIWIPGRPHYRLAAALGFSPARILTGLYACDVASFSPPADPMPGDPPAFLFVGRLEAVKGIDTLLAAFLQYRQSVETAWNLKVVGAGNLASALASEPHIEHVPFVQPAALPKLLWSASAFVMPSHFEPWGVAIQEAAAAGLPLICSDACGAAGHLLDHNHNGMLFQTGDARALADCLKRVSQLPLETRRVWGRRGQRLASEFTPSRWVETLQQVCLR